MPTFSVPPAETGLLESRRSDIVVPFFVVRLNRGSMHAEILLPNGWKLPVTFAVVT